MQDLSHRGSEVRHQRCRRGVLFYISRKSLICRRHKEQPRRPEPRTACLFANHIALISCSLTASSSSGVPTTATFCSRRRRMVSCWRLLSCNSAAVPMAQAIECCGQSPRFSPSLGRKTNFKSSNGSGGSCEPLLRNVRCGWPCCAGSPLGGKLDVAWTSFLRFRATRNKVPSWFS